MLEYPDRHKKESFWSRFFERATEAVLRTPVLGPTIGGALFTFGLLTRPLSLPSELAVGAWSKKRAERARDFPLDPLLDPSWRETRVKEENGQIYVKVPEWFVYRAPTEYFFRHWLPEKVSRLTGGKPLVLPGAVIQPKSSQEMWIPLSVYQEHASKLKRITPETGLLEAYEKARADDFWHDLWDTSISDPLIVLDVGIAATTGGLGVLAKKGATSAIARTGARSSFLPILRSTSLSFEEMYRVARTVSWAWEAYNRFALLPFRPLIWLPKQVLKSVGLLERTKVGRLYTEARQVREALRRWERDNFEVGVLTEPSEKPGTASVTFVFFKTDPKNRHEPKKLKEKDILLFQDTVIENFKSFGLNNPRVTLDPTGTQGLAHFEVPEDKIADLQELLLHFMYGTTPPPPPEPKAPGPDFGPEPEPEMPTSPAPPAPEGAAPEPEARFGTGPEEPVPEVFEKRAEGAAQATAPEPQPQPQPRPQAEPEEKGMKIPRRGFRLLEPEQRYFTTVTTAEPEAIGAVSVTKPSQLLVSPDDPIYYLLYEGEPGTPPILAQPLPRGYFGPWPKVGYAESGWSFMDPKYRYGELRSPVRSLASHPDWVHLDIPPAFVDVVNVEPPFRGTPAHQAWSEKAKEVIDASWSIVQSIMRELHILGYRPEDLFSLPNPLTWRDQAPFAPSGFRVRPWVKGTDVEVWTIAPDEATGKPKVVVFLPLRIPHEIYGEKVNLYFGAVTVLDPDGYAVFYIHRRGFQDNPLRAVQQARQDLFVELTESRLASLHNLRQDILDLLALAKAKGFDWGSLDKGSKRDLTRLLHLIRQAAVESQDIVKEGIVREEAREGLDYLVRVLSKTGREIAALNGSLFRVRDLSPGELLQLEKAVEIYRQEMARQGVDPNELYNDSYVDYLVSLADQVSKDEELLSRLAEPVPILAPPFHPGFTGPIFPNKAQERRLLERRLPSQEDYERWREELLRLEQEIRDLRSLGAAGPLEEVPKKPEKSLLYVEEKTFLTPHFVAAYFRGGRNGYVPLVVLGRDFSGQHAEILQRYSPEALEAIRRLAASRGLPWVLDLSPQELQRLGVEQAEQLFPEGLLLLRLDSAEAEASRFDLSRGLRQATEKLEQRGARGLLALLPRPEDGVPPSVVIPWILSLSRDELPVRLIDTTGQGQKVWEEFTNLAAKAHQEFSSAGLSEEGVALPFGANFDAAAAASVSHLVWDPRWISKETRKELLPFLRGGPFVYTGVLDQLDQGWGNPYRFENPSEALQRYLNFILIDPKRIRQVAALRGRIFLDEGASKVGHAHLLAWLANVYLPEQRALGHSPEEIALEARRLFGEKFPETLSYQPPLSEEMAESLVDGPGPFSLSVPDSPLREVFYEVYVPKEDYKWIRKGQLIPLNQAFGRGEKVPIAFVVIKEVGDEVEYIPLAKDYRRVVFTELGPLFEVDEKSFVLDEKYLGFSWSERIGKWEKIPVYDPDFGPPGSTSLGEDEWFSLEAVYRLHEPGFESFYYIPAVAKKGGYYRTAVAYLPSEDLVHYPRKFPRSGGSQAKEGQQVAQEQSPRKQDLTAREKAERFVRFVVGAEDEKGSLEEIKSDIELVDAQLLVERAASDPEFRKEAFQIVLDMNDKRLVLLSLRADHIMNSLKEADEDLYELLEDFHKSLSIFAGRYVRTFWIRPRIFDDNSPHFMALQISHNTDLFPAWRLRGERRESYSGILFGKTRFQTLGGLADFLLIRRLGLLDELASAAPEVHQKVVSGGVLERSDEFRLSRVLRGKLSSKTLEDERAAELEAFTIAIQQDPTLAEAVLRFAQLYGKSIPRDSKIAFEEPRFLDALNQVLQRIDFPVGEKIGKKPLRVLLVAPLNQEPNWALLRLALAPLHPDSVVFTVSPSVYPGVEDFHTEGVAKYLGYSTEELKPDRGRWADLRARGIDVALVFTPPGQELQPVLNDLSQQGITTIKVKTVRDAIQARKGLIKLSGGAVEAPPVPVEKPEPPRAPVAERPVAPVAQEPPAPKEAVAEKPVSEESVTEEPVTEEPVAEEPQTLQPQVEAEVETKAEQVQEEVAPEEAAPEVAPVEEPKAEEVKPEEARREEAGQEESAQEATEAPESPEEWYDEVAEEGGKKEKGERRTPRWMELRDRRGPAAGLQALFGLSPGERFAPHRRRMDPSFFLERFASDEEFMYSVTNLGKEIEDLIFEAVPQLEEKRNLGESIASDQISVNYLRFYYRYVDSNWVVPQYDPQSLKTADLAKIVEEKRAIFSSWRRVGAHSSEYIGFYDPSGAFFKDFDSLLLYYYLERSGLKERFAQDHPEVYRKLQSAQDLEQDEAWKNSEKAWKIIEGYGPIDKKAMEEAFFEAYRRFLEVDSVEMEAFVGLIPRLKGELDKKSRNLPAVKALKRLAEQVDFPTEEGIGRKTLKVLVVTPERMEPNWALLRTALASLNKKSEVVVLAKGVYSDVTDVHAKGAAKQLGLSVKVLSRQEGHRPDFQAEGIDVALVFAPQEYELFEVTKDLIQQGIRTLWVSSPSTALYARKKLLQLSAYQQAQGKVIVSRFEPIPETLREEKAIRVFPVVFGVDPRTGARKIISSLPEEVDRSFAHLVRELKPGELSPVRELRRGERFVLVGLLSHRISGAEETNREVFQKLVQQVLPSGSLVIRAAGFPVDYWSLGELSRGAAATGNKVYLIAASDSQEDFLLDRLAKILTPEPQEQVTGSGIDADALARGIVRSAYALSEGRGGLARSLLERYGLVVEETGTGLQVIDPTSQQHFFLAFGGRPTALMAQLEAVLGAQLKLTESQLLDFAKAKQQQDLRERLFRLGFGRRESGRLALPQGPERVLLGDDVSSLSFRIADSALALYRFLDSIEAGAQKTLQGAKGKDFDPKNVLTDARAKALRSVLEKTFTGNFGDYRFDFELTPGTIKISAQVLPPVGKAAKRRGEAVSFFRSASLPEGTSFKKDTVTLELPFGIPSEEKFERIISYIGLLFRQGIRQGGYHLSDRVKTGILRSAAQITNLLPPHDKMRQVVEDLAERWRSSISFEEALARSEEAVLTAPEQEAISEMASLTKSSLDELLRRGEEIAPEQLAKSLFLGYLSGSPGQKAQEYRHLGNQEVRRLTGIDPVEAVAKAVFGDTRDLVRVLVSLNPAVELRPSGAIFRNGPRSFTLGRFGADQPVDAFFVMGLGQEAESLELRLRQLLGGLPESSVFEHLSEEMSESSIAAEVGRIRERLNALRLGLSEKEEPSLRQPLFMVSPGLSSKLALFAKKERGGPVTLATLVRLLLEDQGALRSILDTYFPGSRLEQRPDGTWAVVRSSTLSEEEVRSFAERLSQKLQLEKSFAQEFHRLSQSMDADAARLAYEILEQISDQTWLPEEVRKRFVEGALSPERLLLENLVGLLQRQDPLSPEGAFRLGQLFRHLQELFPTGEPVLGNILRNLFTRQEPSVRDQAALSAYLRLLADQETWSAIADRQEASLVPLGLAHQGLNELRQKEPDTQRLLGITTALSGLFQHFEGTLGQKLDMVSSLLEGPPVQGLQDVLDSVEGVLLDVVKEVGDIASEGLVRQWGVEELLAPFFDLISERVQHYRSFVAEATQQASPILSRLEAEEETITSRLRSLKQEIVQETDPVSRQALIEAYRTHEQQLNDLRLAKEEAQAVASGRLAFAERVRYYNELKRRLSSQERELRKAIDEFEGLLDPSGKLRAIVERFGLPDHIDIGPRPSSWDFLSNLSSWLAERIRQDEKITKEQKTALIGALEGRFHLTAWEAEQFLPRPLDTLYKVLREVADNNVESTSRLMALASLGQIRSLLGQSKQEVVDEVLSWLNRLTLSLEPLKFYLGTPVLPLRGSVDPDQVISEAEQRIGRKLTEEEREQVIQQSVRRIESLRELVSREREERQKKLAEFLDRVYALKAEIEGYVSLLEFALSQEQVIQKEHSRFLATTGAEDVNSLVKRLDQLEQLVARAKEQLPSWARRVARGDERPSEVMQELLENDLLDPGELELLVERLKEFGSGVKEVPVFEFRGPEDLAQSVLTMTFGRDVSEDLYQVVVRAKDLLKKEQELVQQGAEEFIVEPKPAEAPQPLSLRSRPSQRYEVEFLADLQEPIDTIARFFLRAAKLLAKKAEVAQKMVETVYEERAALGQTDFLLSLQPDRMAELAEQAEALGRSIELERRIHSALRHALPISSPPKELAGMVPALQEAGAELVAVQTKTGGRRIFAAWKVRGEYLISASAEQLLAAQRSGKLDQLLWQKAAVAESLRDESFVGRIRPYLLKKIARQAQEILTYALSPLEAREELIHLTKEGVRIELDFGEVSDKPLEARTSRTVWEYLRDEFDLENLVPLLDEFWQSVQEVAIRSQEDLPIEDRIARAVTERLKELCLG